MLFSLPSEIGLDSRAEFVPGLVREALEDVMSCEVSEESRLDCGVDKIRGRRVVLVRGTRAVDKRSSRRAPGQVTSWRAVSFRG